MGDGFNTKTGGFVAPKSGVYQFISTAVMASIPKNADSFNVVEFELTLEERVKEDTEVVGKSTSTKEAGKSMTIAATLKLKKGDKIYMATQQGGGYEIKWASFTGSLLEAEQ